MIPKLQIFIFILAVLFYSSCNKENTGSSAIVSGDNLFERLPSSVTNINFRNTLSEGPNTNILMYEYFYNGGGVAIGDVNNDGLEDIYFSSNMGQNKLFLNKGNFYFEDITEAANVTGKPGPWKTGVSMVDVNGDGLLDIYLCYSGALPDEKRANQLFINKGLNKDSIPVFEEEAERYGLASIAYSNQAYFFDFDRDGDLDMLLLNHNPKSMPVLNEFTTKQKIVEDDPLIGIRLFQNNDNFFTDITPQSGISSSSLTYGLGIGIADLNNDGWPDFYVSNDYTIPDYLYINNKNGTFTDQLKDCLNQTSHFSMGNDVVDVNNDGLADIFTLDMLPEDNKRQKLLLSPDNYPKFDLNIRSGFHHQYMRNMLHLNNGNDTYTEVGQMSGISNTDWSWSALFADFNNNGFKDLYITNGYNRDYTNLDFIDYMDQYVQNKGRLVREDVLDLIAQMPASNITNYMFANNGNFQFENKTSEWGLSYPSNSNGAAFADLDNDGDLDLIVNNINIEAFVFRNNSEKTQNNYLSIALSDESKNTFALGAKVTAFFGNQISMQEAFPMRGYLSSVSPRIHFGLGANEKIDSIHITWPEGMTTAYYDISANQHLQIHYDIKDKISLLAKNDKKVFTPIKSALSHIDVVEKVARDFDRQPLLIKEPSVSGPVITSGNLNDDINDELYISGSQGIPASIYTVDRLQNFVKTNHPVLEKYKDHHDTDALIFDANGDGKNDIYVCSGGYHQFKQDDKLLQDRLYINTGDGRLEDKTSQIPVMLTSSSCVVALDINGDGASDLFVGGHVIPGRYPEIPRSYILINDGSGNFSDQTININSDLAEIGMVTDAASADINGDGINDLVVIGHWMPVKIFINENGKLIDKSKEYISDELSGWWNVVHLEDINKDNKPDIILGNVGKNHQFQFNKEQPGEMYFDDFDQNGSVDPIYCNYIQGISYPYLTRAEILSQLTYLKSKFTSFESFSEARLQDILTQEQIKNAGYLKVNTMESLILLSNNSGKFTEVSLPKEVQAAPVFGITVIDYDGDGNKDLLLTGNDSSFKLRLGKMDSNFGILLRGNGTGNFEYIPQLESGLMLKGDIKSIYKNNDVFYFGIYNAPVAAYKMTME